jgi:hypothetical protein
LQAPVTTATTTITQPKSSIQFSFAPQHVSTPLTNQQQQQQKVENAKQHIDKGVLLQNNEIDMNCMCIDDVDQQQTVVRTTIPPQTTSSVPFSFKPQQATTTNANSQQQAVTTATPAFGKSAFGTINKTNNTVPPAAATTSLELQKCVASVDRLVLVSRARTIVEHLMKERERLKQDAQVIRFICVCVCVKCK